MAFVAAAVSLWPCWMVERQVSPPVGWLGICSDACLGVCAPNVRVVPLLMPLHHPLFVTRVTDAVFNFLLVWYYCTLTIRESILINNGSK